MPKATPRIHEWKDEYTFLCERCGYIIEDLNQSLPCPECGKPITESLPEQRIGTPWQQNPSIRSMLATWWISTRHPFKTLSIIRIDDNKFFELITRYWLACVTINTLMQIILLLITGLNMIELMLATLFIFIGATFAGAMIFMLITVEAFGLEFFSKRRKSRLTYSAAWNIVGHGSAWWFTTGCIWILILAVFHTYNQIWPYPGETDWITTPSEKYFLYPGIAIGFLIGFLMFETFAYLGLRRCKYANRTRPIQSEATDA